MLNDEQKEKLHLIAWKQWHKDKELSVRAAQYILNIDPYNHVILSNIQHYLMELPVINELIIDSVNEEHFRPMNTCLSKYNNYLVAFVRSVNYNIVGESYLAGPPDNSYTSLTKMVLLTTDNQTSISKILDIHNQDERWKRGSAIYGGGYEDVRVCPKSYQEDGMTKWIAIGGRYLADEIKLFIFEIIYDDHETVTMSKGYKIQYGGDCEKNWTPFKYDSTKQILTVIYKYSPLVILEIDNKGNVMRSIKDNIKYNLRCDSYRGGSPVVKIKNRYISIVHECRTYDGRFYFNRMVELNKYMQIIGTSYAFNCRTGEKIEYIMGLIASDDEQFVYIAVGVNDSQSRILTIDANILLSLIHTEHHYIEEVKKILEKEYY